MSPNDGSNRGALAGLRGVDRSRHAPGSYCSMQLVGVDIVLVDQPGGSTRGEPVRDLQAAMGLTRSRGTLVEHTVDAVPPALRTRSGDAVVGEAS